MKNAMNKDQTRAAQDNNSKPQLKIIKNENLIDNDSKNNGQKSSVLDQVFHKETVRYHLKQFGLMWLAILSLIAAYKGFKGLDVVGMMKWIVPGMIVTAVSYIAPILIYPFWKGWMKLADILGMVMTPLVMTILWFLTFVPFGLALRICGKKLIDTEYRMGKKSYWMDRDPVRDQIERMKRQF